MEGDPGQRFFRLLGYLLAPAPPRKKDKHFRKSKKAFDHAITKGGVNPLIHRVAASEHYSDSLVDIKTRWTCGDLADALWWLDAIGRASEVDVPKTK